VDRHPDHTLRCVYSGDILSDSEGHFLEKCDE
jgi:endonuclease I